ncbi:hypothetical protein [Salinibacterium sp. TMP30]|uniref:hypothetical protein n=1 Tax=Salinibacterium sp. TMP30 TaxID=3138237 RepID=UPI0031398A48
MSDELTISGGGSYAVATDEMLSNAANLLRAAEQTRDILGALEMVDARLTIGQLESLGIPTAAAIAETDLDYAHSALSQLAYRAELMSGLVRVAAQTYGVGDALAESIVRRLAADAAAVIGFLFPAWAVTVVLTSPLLPILAGIGVATAVLGKANPQLVDHEWISAQLNGLLSDPAFVLALRHGVMTVDELSAGASGVPPAVVSILSAAGVIGLASSAGNIKSAGGVAGVLKETPVMLKNTTQPEPVTAARSVEERVERIPQPTEEHPEQVRIEKYETPGERDRFEVYISGTVDFAVSDTTESFDGTSNLSLAAAQQSGSIAAVAAAMREAGIKSESPVSFTGHSQGAAVAARLAESGEYNTAGVFTVGGNVGQVVIPDDVPTIIVEHTDDLVVAAGGLQDNRHALVVERQAYGGKPLPAGEAVPAHHLSQYAETGRLMDQSDSVELQEAVQRMALFGRDATTATVTSYYYERVLP